jgi:CheY-like chemotaxis protein
MTEKLRVLVVDDNRDALWMLGRLIGKFTCDVCTCQDSRIAVRMVQEFMPHVVFLDISMPGLDGYEVAEDLHDLDLHNYLLVAETGNDDEPHRRECAASGFDFFFGKPISIDQVASVIEIAKERFLTPV